jgi:hypothetical protein
MSADAIATALAPMVTQLVALKEENERLKSSVAPTLQRLETLEERLRDTVAEKSELEQRMLLGNAQKLARKRAWRVSGVPKLIGLCIMLASMPFFFLCIFVHSMQPYFIWAYFATGCGLGCGFISIRPTDVFGIRCIAALAVPMTLQNTIMLGVPVGLIAAPDLVAFPAGDTVRWETVALLVPSMACMVFFLYFAYHTLTHKDGKWIPLSADKALRRWATSRYGSLKGSLLALSSPPVAWAIREQLAGNFVVPPRTAHLLFHKVIPFGCLTFYVPAISLAAYHMATDDGTASSAAARNTYHVLVAGSAQLLIWQLLFTPWFRAWYYTTLNRLSNRGDAGRAAGVAALIGKKDVNLVLAQARRCFQAVPFAKLRREHFATNQADADLMKGIAQRCQLGEVDAFLSHSWHDDPSEKWATLCAWAAAFEAKHGRPPLVWFDKACLDQKDIEDQLAALPVFLAGSRTLLCVVGPTYIERIWCIIEIFTFLRMGGTAERLTVLPIGDGSEELAALTPRDLELREEDLLNGALERFRAFEVSAAKCFSEEQLLHLLSVIESGFGSFDTFNSIVRHAFANKLEQLLADTSRGAPATKGGGGGALSMSTSMTKGSSGLSHRMTSSGALIAPHSGTADHAKGASSKSSTRAEAELDVQDYERVHGTMA